MDLNLVELNLVDPNLAGLSLVELSLVEPNQVGSQPAAKRVRARNRAAKNPEGLVLVRLADSVEVPQGPQRHSQVLCAGLQEHAASGLAVLVPERVGAHPVAMRLDQRTKTVVLVERRSRVAKQCVNCCLPVSVVPTR